MFALSKLARHPTGFRSKSLPSCRMLCWTVKQSRGDGSDSSDPTASLDLDHNPQSGASREDGQSPELEVGSGCTSLAIVSAGHSDGRPIRGKYFPKMGSNPDSVVKNNLTACSP